MNRILFLLLFFFCSPTVLKAQKAELVLPLIHGSTIRGMSFSANGQYLVSCSDKSIKLWEVETGNLIRTIQDDPAEVAKREGWAGGFSVVALSSDGTQIASARLCGSAFERRPSIATSIELWDAKTGQKIKEVIKGFQVRTCIQELSFSADDQYLLASFAIDNMDHSILQVDIVTKVWNLQTGEIIIEREGEKGSLSQDAKHLVSWKKNEVHWIDIASQQQQTFTTVDAIDKASVSGDGQHLFALSKGQLLVWNIAQQQQIGIHKVNHPESKYRPTIHFSTDRNILTTSEFIQERFVIRQFNSLNGQLINQQQFDVSQPIGTWSPDGSTFACASSDNLGATHFLMRTLDIKKGQISNVFGLAELQKNWFVHASKLSVSGKSCFFSFYAPFHKKYFLFNPKSKRLVQKHDDLILPDLEGQVYFDMEKLQCKDFSDRSVIWQANLNPDHVLNAVFAEDGSLALLTNNREMIVFDQAGKELERFQNIPEFHDKLAYTRKTQRLYQIGKEAKQQVYDLNKQVLSPLTSSNAPPREATLQESEIWGIESPDDISLRLFKKSDPSVTLATVIAIGEQDWVVATPNGLFDASPGAMKSLHYAYEMELIELDQLKERYYEPGLLEKILGLEKGENRDPSKYSAVKLYPKVSATLSGDELSINLVPRNGGMGKLSLFINGKEVEENVNPSRSKDLQLSLKNYAKYYLPGQVNQLTLRSFNEEGWLKSQAYNLSYTPNFSLSRGSGSTGSGNNNAKPSRPHLYALIVGTADYSGTNLDLAYSDKDAAAIHQALQSAGKALFNQNTDIQLLSTDTEAAGKISSKENIQKALEEFAGKAKANDVLIIYFAGHGVTYGQAEKMQFYYLTKDIGSEDLSDPEIRHNFAISTAELTSWLTAIPAQKQVMMLDACNSGKVVESLVSQRALNSSQIRALDRMKDRTGMFVISGSAADKVSYEASQYGQGLLTYSLLQGMQMVSANNNEYVDVMQLFQYSRDRVPQLAKGIGGIQTPMLAFPNDGSSFDIGIVNESVEIPVARVKPVFSRNIFQDENAFADVLGLGNKMSDYFKKISSRGANAAYIYVDVAQFENAYSLKGRYTVNGEEVKVRGALFKGTQNIGPFEVSGKKTELNQLIDDIIFEVEGMVE